MSVQNVLFIALDDCASPDILGQFGVPLVVPGFDMLAERGTTFRKAYCEIAVCKPARWAVMSGYSSFQTGIFDLGEEEWRTLSPQQLWPYRLKQAGFYNSTRGKIFHGYGPIPRQHHDVLYSHPPFVVSFGPPTSWPRNDYGGGMGPFGYIDADEQYYDYKSVMNAIEFMRGHDPQKPFYCEVGLHHPHTGWDTPDWCKRAYNVDDIIAPADWQGGFDIAEFGRNMMLSLSEEGRPGAEFADFWRKTLRNMLSATTHAAAEVARLLEYLWSSPHADTTMVVLYSDHGYHAGDRYSWHKFTMYEEAARAPLYVYVPGQTPKVVDAPVSHMDIGQTILDYAGLPQMEHCPGISLRPYIEGGAIPDRWVPTFWYGSASVTDGNTRIIRYQDGTSELYDVATNDHLTTPLPLNDARFAPALDGLLEECARRGYLLVEQGMAATPGAPWVGLLGGEDDDLPPGANYASIAPRTRYAEAPGYRRQIISVVGNNEEILLGPDADWVHVFTGRNVTGVSLVARGQQDRRIWLNGNADYPVARIELEGGNNYIVSGNGAALHLTAGSGNDTVVQGSVLQDIIHLGAGDDVVMNAHRGHDIIHGGAGNDWINGERNNDTLYGGPGDDTLLGGAHEDELHADAGSDILYGGAGADRFVIYRTECLQQIMDLEEIDTIDLSRWAPLQPVTVRQLGADVEITAGLERIICRSTTAAIAKACIRGATIA
ncbi:sulfatase-like hydrolase/transferase [Paracoccus sp. 11-3]|uniref:Sulfatase-like hydrolase/transferase n=1 Tax=Paracoccus amoyensis TaxID=2760093 RepID=A0A926GMS5_9RHOB|nr:sulfatase-like hydrolase/transferase [Paracoccus amoyensis]MBC9246755.1 sulfatase-like hydrolase/transferase [Paracoccus amoyensis]